jgi:hypothetical protein
MNKKFVYQVGNNKKVFDTRHNERHVNDPQLIKRMIMKLPVVIRAVFAREYVTSFKKDIKTLLVRKGTCTFFYIAVDTPKLCTLLVPTPFIKSYTALCNVLGPIAIDFTFIHCTYVLYIFNIKVEISYLTVYRFCRHTCSCMMV